MSLFRTKNPKKPDKSKTGDDDDEEDVEYENVHEEQRDLSTIELIFNSNFTRDRSQKGLQGITLDIGPESLRKGDFITEGWKRIAKPRWEMGSENNQHVLCRKVKFSPHIEEGLERWYTIDGEKFEAIPIETTLLRNRLKFYKCDDQVPS